MFTLQQLQNEHKPWIEYNFHPIDKQYSYQPFEGIVEELGELEQAANYDEAIDAIGDCLVFMSDFNSCLNLRFDELNDNTTTVLTPSGILMTLGKLGHAHLKMMQNIRGSEELHMVTIRACLMILISHLRAQLNLLNEFYHFEGTLEQVCEKVWSQVSKRDWQKDRLNGGE